MSRLAARPANAPERGGMADLQGGHQSWFGGPNLLHPKKESSARPYSQQGAVLSVQLVDPIIAGSIQIYLLCLQPERLSRSLAARIS